MCIHMCIYIYKYLQKNILYIIKIYIYIYINIYISRIPVWVPGIILLKSVKQHLSIHHPSGFNWHPLEGAGVLLKASFALRQKLTFSSLATFFIQVYQS